MAAKIKFEFRDSSLFRIVHADGVFGGPTPSGDLYLSFYNERSAMPKSVTHMLEGNTAGAEIMEERVVSSEGIERTNEVAVLMSFATAVSFREWLSRRINDMVAQNPELAKAEEETKKQVQAKLPVSKVTH